MHEFPQALPFEHTLQHAIRLAAGVPSAGSADRLLPRLAVAIDNAKPMTVAQIRNAALIVHSLSGGSGYGVSG
jgi:hypothetical protein